ncbi:MAG: sugar transferase [Chloroflexota bacterium]|nr:sugar transferase [Chloroflexota bacterium]MDE2946007.1 sugar transferase [Chloroflexota bacterium]
MNTHRTLSERPTLEPRWFLPAIDAVTAFLVFGAAYILRYDLQIILPAYDPLERGFDPYIPFAAVYALLIWLNFQRNGLYRNIAGRAWLEEVYLIASSVAVSIVIELAMFYILQPLVTSRLMLIYVAALTLFTGALSRLIRRWILAYLRHQGIGIRRVLIVGMGEVGRSLLGIMLTRPEFGYQPVGFLDDDAEKVAASMGRVEALGGTGQLADIIKQHMIDTVVITFRWKHYDLIQELTEVCREADTDLRIVPEIMQLNIRQVQVENLDGIPLLGIGAHRSFSRANQLLKRGLDMLVIIAGFPLWAPISLLVSLALALEGKGPVIYRQVRVGKDGQKFEMLKFRSMVANAEALQEAMLRESGEDPRHPKFVDDPRVTGVGRFLRRSSLDELPNLINVLRGEMSLVGPRPPTPSEVELYEARHRRRLQITPGMTGWWQVRGRSNVPFDEMCEMDMYYIDNWSIAMDIEILMLTIPRVVLRSGAV